MKPFSRLGMILILPILDGLLMITAWNAPGAVVALQADPTPAPTLAKIDMSTFDRGILLNLPPDVSQAEFGWEVYRLICSACHAYDGTGLTAEWLASWDPADQNCWQSKCHALNHPPDGFYLPIAPPVVGAIIPRDFATIQELYEYNLTQMPWHDPGMMSEKEAWAVTAHILRKNGYAVPEELGPDNAAEIDLRAGDAALRAQAIFQTAVAAPVSDSVFPAGAATGVPQIDLVTPTATRAPPTPSATAAPPTPAPTVALPVVQMRSIAPLIWIWALPIGFILALILAGIILSRRENIE